MIGSILITLLPNEDIMCAGLGGEALHGLFYSVLKTKSAELVAKLHHSSIEVPFSISPFLQKCGLKQGYCLLAKDNRATFRLTLLHEEILTSVVSAFFTAAAERRTFQLCGKPLSISEINLRRGKFVSFTSFDKILAEAPSQSTLTLEFFSPTCFKADRTQLLFPEPRLVFSSLLKKWNAFSPTKLPQDSVADFASIKVASYDLHTSLVRFSSYKIIGSVGKITYKLPQDREQCKMLNALADFAFYCGTGAKTTMGMGQTRRLK